MNPQMRPYHYGLCVAVISLLCDQMSKYMVLHHIMVVPYVLEICPIFDVVLTFNKGISFGMLAQSESFGVYLLVALSFAITTFLVLYLKKCHSFYMATALGLMIGGAIGNVIDRVRLHAVVDFLHFHWQTHSFPAFNIADSCITVGAALMLFENLLNDKKTNLIKDDDEKTL